MKWHEVTIMIPNKGLLGTETGEIWKASGLSKDKGPRAALGQAKSSHVTKGCFHQTSAIPGIPLGTPQFRAGSAGRLEDVGRAGLSGCGWGSFHPYLGLRFTKKIQTIDLKPWENRSSAYHGQVAWLEIYNYNFGHLHTAATFFQQSLSMNSMLRCLSTWT